jgi:hypothetical protein
LGGSDVAPRGEQLGVVAFTLGRERGLDLVGLGVDQRKVGQQVQAVDVRVALLVPCRCDTVSRELHAGQGAEQHVVGALELALLDAGDDVVHLGLLHRLGHLAALHLVEHLLGLAGLGRTASNILPCTSGSWCP